MAEATPGRVERGEQAEARAGNSATRGGPKLELSRRRLKNWSKLGPSATLVHAPTYWCLYLLYIAGAPRTSRHEFQYNNKHSEVATNINKSSPRPKAHVANCYLHRCRSRVRRARSSQALPRLQRARGAPPSVQPCQTSPTGCSTRTVQKQDACKQASRQADRREEDSKRSSKQQTVDNM